MNDDVHARLTLLGLPNVGPARLGWLLSAGDPVSVVAQLRQGRLPPEIGQAPRGVDRAQVQDWFKQVRKVDAKADMSAYAEAGVEIIAPSDPRWPFTEDPEPPMLVFCKGDLSLLDIAGAVAVVGTRRCTGVGRAVANRLGFDLADAGYPVVSGLALGIDGAVHRGALDAGGIVIGVVGTGLDVVYPRANQSLWEEVADVGLLMSEFPLGTGPSRWRFPARNRLIAGLAAGVVVVESHAKGGALSTVDEAADRGRLVMAVPGSVLSRASDGTNALLVEGAAPVRDAADVLSQLGLPQPAKQSEPKTGVEGSVGSGSDDQPDRRTAPETFWAEESETAGQSATTEETDFPPGSLEALILTEIATGPVHTDRLVAVCGQPVSTVLAVVQRLQSAGRVTVDGSTVSLGHGPQ